MGGMDGSDEAAHRIGSGGGGLEIGEAAGGARGGDQAALVVADHRQSVGHRKRAPAGKGIGSSARGKRFAGDAGGEVQRLVPRHGQRGGGVEHDDVVIGAPFAGEQGAQPGGIVRRVAAGKRGFGMAADIGSFG